MHLPHPIATPELVDGARAGDRAAFESIWTLYQPQLLRFLRAQGATNPDDVTSQVWIDVGRSIARFEGDGLALRRWVFTIARRRNIDDIRSAARRQHRLSTLQSQAVVTTSHDSIDDRADDLDAAIDLLRQLPPRTAEVVMLRTVYDLGVDDVAEICDITPGNVRVIAHRGLRQLREIIQQDHSARSEAQV